MRRLLLAAIAFGAISSAHAADLPFLRGGFTDGYSRAPVSWQGIYVGGQGSWGSQKSLVPGVEDLQHFAAQPAGVAFYQFLPPPPSTANSLNGGYGGFLGYNSQYEDVVVGIEGNYTHDDFRATTTALRVNSIPGLMQSVTNSSVTMKLPDFGSARLRAGYMMGCFLPYGFIGAGLGEQTIDRAVSVSPSPTVGPASLADSKSKLIYGYTAGVGFDVQLIGGVFGRFEYEYRRITSDFESNINTVRVGLGYKF
jgi:opacity protein-like surface antigen